MIQPSGKSRVFFLVLVTLALLSLFVLLLFLGRKPVEDAAHPGRSAVPQGTVLPGSAPVDESVDPRVSVDASQVPSRDAQTSHTGKTAAIRVKVLFEGLPFPGAQVVLRGVSPGQDLDSETSGPDGIAEISINGFSGDMDLSASAPGKISAQTLRLQSLPASGQELSLDLYSAATLIVGVEGGGEGIVIAAGKAFYEADAMRPAIGGEWQSRRFEAKTDLSGRAALVEVPAQIRLQASMDTPACMAQTQIVQPLAPGELREIVLPCKAVPRVRILVRNEAGDSVAGATVGFLEREIGKTNASGELVCSVRSLDAVVAEGLLPIFWAYRKGSGFGYRDDLSPSSLARGEEVGIVLLGNGIIEGIVVDSQDRPVKGVRLRVEFGPKILPFQMPSPTPGSILDRIENSDHPEGRSVSGPDGRFRLEGLPPSTYAIECMPSQGASFSVEGISAGVRNLKIRIPMQEDADGSKIRFLVEVVDAWSGQPVSGADVTLWKLDGKPTATDKIPHNSRQGIHAASGPKGIASFLPSDPWWYWVSAQAPGYLEVDGEVVRYEAGIRQIRLELSPAGAFGGRIVDQDGKPLHEARLLVYDERHRLLTLVVQSGEGSGRRSADWVFSDDQGRFRVDEVKAGSHTLVVQWGKGYPNKKTLPLSVIPGQKKEISISVP